MLISLSIDTNHNCHWLFNLKPQVKVLIAIFMGVRYDAAVNFNKLNADFMDVVTKA
jgi:hypothetical protein